MKMLGIWTALTLVILLTACKNRFESYEPYSYYDEKMAAAAQTQGEEYQASQYSGNEFDENYYYADRPPPAPVRNSRAEAPPAPGSNNEVPFNSSRGEKHAANIGSLDYPLGV